MSNLKTYKFSELYEMSSGISSKPEQAGHGSHFVSFKIVFNNYFLPDVLYEFMDISPKEKEIYSIKKGDIFLTRTSETLNELGMSCVAIKDYPASSFSGFLKRLRPTQDDITYDKFIAFYLRSDLFRKTMTNNSIMTLRASLNEHIFSYLELILPDYEEQKKAGDFLYSINAKIELNNRINKELEAMAKTLYDYWFVQFDFPAPETISGQTGKPYKTSGGKMVWNEELKREIPEGWNVISLENLCDIYQSKTISGKEMVLSGKYNVYGSNGIIGKYDKYNHEQSQIIISCRGNCGNIFRTRPKSWITGNAMVFKLINDKVSSEFLYQSLHWLKLKKITTGSVQGQITRTNVTKLKILIPPDDLLKKNKTFFENIIQKKLSILDENQKLASLRDWLLPMLMNGQVSVGEVENIN
jgi:type I restriction enzyme S subunit